MPYTRDIDMPLAARSGAPCPAGEGPRAHRVHRGTQWPWQLQAWGLRALTPDTERRLWVVYTAREGEGKCERTLPSGRRIFFYDRGLHGLYRKAKGPLWGPYYWLTFADARALWLDHWVSIKPACEQFVVRGAS